MDTEQTTHYTECKKALTLVSLIAPERLQAILEILESFTSEPDVDVQQYAAAALANYHRRA